MEKLILPPIGESSESQITPGSLPIPKEGLGLCKIVFILIYLLPASPGTMPRMRPALPCSYYGPRRVKHRPSKIRKTKDTEGDAEGLGLSTELVELEEGWAPRLDSRILKGFSHQNNSVSLWLQPSVVSLCKALTSSPPLNSVKFINSLTHWVAAVALHSFPSQLCLIFLLHVAYHNIFLLIY